ncbi:inactive poly [ADP-ribose] polymerase RCD1-like [Lotus japonicus]|uniref:inactive poly [ADP-ribose] polymerase RCD1-like n=1 Tax=Lotus japonicus TaxID=34305 RepID=UPI00258B3068|nr:inactive poly [ADP-ribose] polymerase RCD1-like [Lotus japonicus]
MRFVDYESKKANVGPHSGKFFLQHYLNYKKSGKPESVMLYNNGEWLDYPRNVVNLVKNEFEMKKVVVEIRLNERNLILDFLHMCQLDLKIGLRQPIGWIDEVGECFFPEINDFSGEESHKLWNQDGVKLGIQVEVDGVDEFNLRECIEKSNGGEVILHNHVSLVPSAESVQRKLDLDFVKIMFLTGMSIFESTDFEILETYPCSGTSMQVRFELFRAQAKMTKECHGEANVRYAWLPFYKGELSKMMEYGLRHCTLGATKCTYNGGVHLAAVTCPYASARYCDIDEGGVRHLVLCRVIMGNMKVFYPSIATDTGLFQPSNSQYDNGVDDIQCPRYYIVWNMNINTHIYPEFIISFKVYGDAKGHFCGTMGEKNDSNSNSSMVNSASHSSGDLLHVTSSMDNNVSYLI